MRIGRFKWKHEFCKLAFGILLVTSIYITTYVIDSFFGGYWLVPERDGHDKYSFGLSVTDAILWQPYFGHMASGNFDLIGIAYQPLIKLDRAFFHKTLRFFDSNFDREFSSLAASQIHPHWRDEFSTKVTASLKTDLSDQTIHCSFHLTGSHYPRAITGIKIRKDLANSLKCPAGFEDKSFKSYERHERENYVCWTGKLSLIEAKDVSLAISTEGSLTSTGNIIFIYQRTDTTSHDFENFCVGKIK